MDVGKKLRLLRGNMTQSELAQRSGIDKAIISKIESGKMYGTVECHEKLAEAFGLKLSEFYAFVEENKRSLVEMHSGNVKTDFYRNFLVILTTIPLSKKMLPTFLTLQPGEENFLVETVKNVERFVMILEGKVDIEVEGKTYQLKKDPDAKEGDSLYSMSQQRHAIKNTGDTSARLICVSSPPVL